MHELVGTGAGSRAQGAASTTQKSRPPTSARKPPGNTSVERWHGNGRPNTFDRAYAMTNPMVYFAETTEAFFSRNDFFPFNRDELKQHDPEMFALLSKLRGVPSAHK